MTISNTNISQLSPKERLRRVALLCLHCMRNLAYYRARRESNNTPAAGQFWITVDGNFLDICIMEWCKGFAEPRGKHHWKKVVNDHGMFLTGLLAELQCTEDQWQDYISEIREYRDKFVAHLDDNRDMDIPVLDWTKTSTFFLYNYLIQNEEIDNCFAGIPSVEDYYQKHSDEAEAIYKGGTV